MYSSGTGPGLTNICLTVTSGLDACLGAQESLFHCVEVKGLWNPYGLSGFGAWMKLGCSVWSFKCGSVPWVRPL